jgi:hypothetical protein
MYVLRHQSYIERFLIKVSSFLALDQEPLRSIIMVVEAIPNMLLCAFIINLIEFRTAKFKCLRKPLITDLWYLFFENYTTYSVLPTMPLCLALKLYIRSWTRI